MSKKVLSIVLAFAMLLGTFAVASFAAVDYKDLIDRQFLSGKANGTDDVKEADSEEIRMHFLSFWDDEVIADYNNAKTNADYEALYNKMSTPFLNDETWEGSYYLHRDESKAVIDVKYTTDVTEVEAGDTVTVTCNMTTNFWASWIYAGVFYNKNQVTLVDTSYNTELFSTWQKFAENRHFGIYDNAYGDQRFSDWPASLRNEEAYDKYEAVRLLFSPDSNKAGYSKALKPSNSVIFTATFTVNDGVAPGEQIEFFAPADSTKNLAELDSLLEQGVDIPAALFELYHCTSEFDDDSPDAYGDFNQSVKCTKGIVEVKNNAAVEAADYTALDEAVANFDKLDASRYTASSWSAYKAAVDAAKLISRDLTKESQGIIDDAVAAINSVNLREVGLVSVSTVGTPTIGAEANVKVVVTGSPESIKFGASNDTWLTFSRDNAVITASEDDTETWLVKVYVGEESNNFVAYAKYGFGTVLEGLPFEIKAVDGKDISIHSIEIPDYYPANKIADGAILMGRHNVIVRTSKDVHKIQLVTPEGATFTYDKIKYTPVVDGDELVWTLNHSFSTLGVLDLTVRTRSENTTFVDTGDKITGTVLY